MTVLGTLLLAGCSFGVTTEDKVSKILGDMYSAEDTYRESQKELQALEQEEQKLFNETIELTQEETEQVAENVNDLQEILTERIAKINEEEEAMKNAEKLLSEFNKIEGKLEQHEQQVIEQLKDSIAKRYKAHANIVESYKELTNIQKSLYDLLVNEKTDVTALNKQVDAVNTQNETVVAAIKGFNDATNHLNVIRDEVYDIFEKE